MNTEHLQNIYKNNIDRIFKIEDFKVIADHHFNIGCDTFTNRVLAYIQNKFATDVRTDNSWEASGRKIKDRAVPIWLIKAVTDTQFLDSRTNSVADISKLTPQEVKEAVNQGIINKEINIKDFKCIQAYDIRDTVEVVNNSIKENSKLKVSTILSILNAIGIKIDKDDTSCISFDYDTNTLKYGEGSLKEKLMVLFEALAIFIVNEHDVDIEFGDIIERVAILYSRYSIFTFLDLDTSDLDFSILESVDNECMCELISVLEDIEPIVFAIITSNLKETNRKISQDKMARAAVLLSILESNYQINNLRGE